MLGPQRIRGADGLTDGIGADAEAESTQAALKRSTGLHAMKCRCGAEQCRGYTFRKREAGSRVPAAAAGSSVSARGRKAPFLPKFVL